MAVQRSTDLTNKPFILMGPGMSKAQEVVVQDAGRSTAMAIFTLMSYDPATAKWHPFTDETATDGTQFPRGILMKSLTAAEIVAGDVADVPILVGDAIVDQNQVVIENSKTLATVINAPAGLNITVEENLRTIGIFCQDTIDITAPEA